MASTDFLPAREAELMTWVNRFSSLIGASPTTYGLTAQMATNYSALVTAFINACNVVQADATRSPSNIIARNQAKVYLLRTTRQLAGIVQKFPGTTNPMRSDLGLTVPSQPTPIPPPAAAPELVILRRDRTNVLVRLLDANSQRRGKPLGVQGARIYSFVGANPPADVDGWRFEGRATRTRVNVSFPAETAAGTKVWLAACWYNPRGETGPASRPVGAFIAGAMVPMQLAA